MRLNFLGRPCAATELPGLIAQRFRTNRWIFWTERKGFWRAELKTHRLTSEDAARLTLESNAWLETKLKTDEEACACWLWAHDRWKNGSSDFIPDLVIKKP